MIVRCEQYAVLSGGWRLQDSALLSLTARTAFLILSERET